MSKGKFGKTENEKIMERRSKLNRWKSEIERAIRSYERNRERNVDDIKMALEDENDQKARIFASNIVMLNSAIRGLKDYKLFLDNIDLNLQFAKTTKDIWASLKEGSQDLIKSQLSDKQLTQINTNIENIMMSSDQIQERLNSQLDQITSSVDQIGQKNHEKVEDILSGIRNKISVSASSAPSQENAQKAPSTVNGDEESGDELIKKLGQNKESEKE